MTTRLVRRIAMLSVHTCPLATLGGKKTGGMNVYVRDFCRELGRQGLLVDVFTRSQDDCQPMVNHDLGQGARVIHIPAGPERPIPVVDIEQHLDAFVKNTRDFAEKEGIEYDLIHSHYWLSGLVAHRLRQAWGQHIPLVQMFHTLGLMKNRIATSEEQRASPARIEGETFIIHQVADVIIAATPAEEAQLFWLYDADKARIKVIPPGIDLERFRPMPAAVARARIGVDEHRRLLIFAGRIEPLKGIDTLLKAIALLQHHYPSVIENVCVAIIGGDPWADTPEAEMARLQDIRGELEIGDRVTFLGAKIQEELPAYYAAADLVVMPSHYESFGLVALEAMAMGTPVIASEVGGLAFLVRHGETGLHVPSRDPEALAEAVLLLLQDDALRRQYGQQAQAVAQQYDWDIIVERMLALYESLWQQASARSRVETRPPA